MTPTSADGSVYILQSENLDDFNSSTPILLWTPPNPAAWAPELHIIDGNFYIYTALQDGDEDSDRRSVRSSHKMECDDDSCIWTRSLGCMC